MGVVQTFAIGMLMFNDTVVSTIWVFLTEALLCYLRMTMGIVRGHRRACALSVLTGACYTAQHRKQGFGGRPVPQVVDECRRCCAVAAL